MDCSATTAHVAQMGEVSGDALTYFVDDRGTQKAGTRDENWRSKGRTQAMPRSLKSGAVTREPPCNVMRIGELLSEPLDISFGDGSKNDRGDVIDLVCKPHPTRPGQTIVALFHDLPGGSTTDGLSTKGFALAVIDAGRQKVIRTYRSQIEEDGGTRVNRGSLRIDTAAYQLTPKVRALGIRMDIRYGPSAADGGHGDELSLFVEEGRSLRPVLKDLVMYSWRFVDSAPCFQNTNDPCIREEERTVLSVAKTQTEGWRDLNVIVTTTNDGDLPAPPVTKVTRTLRLNKGLYQ
jgi:hypothetical protein